MPHDFLAKFFAGLTNFFVYNPTEPFSFLSVLFWVFFCLVLAGYSIVYKKTAARNAFLFIVSLFFYYKTGGFYFTILLFSTVTDFWIGFRIAKSKKLSRKLWLALSIFINLAVLLYFKYAYFFADSLNSWLELGLHPTNHFAALANTAFDTRFTADVIVLPIGISFFTFQTMSYAIDIYRGEVKPVKNILDFGFYVSFFPQLVAGPIVRAAKFIPQLYRPFQLSNRMFGLGLFWIINGLLKKMFLADYLALYFVDRVFDNPASATAFENLFALYGYSLQVYADFSGYTDVATGLAILLGFHLPVNFNSPYKAHSVGDFWRRWHMSLSGWLKDYLYIPMGGNRKGSFFTFVSLTFILLIVGILIQDWWIIAALPLLVFWVVSLTKIFTKFGRWVVTNVNIMLTMLIGGLWHGASWNFVLWGGLNGAGLVVYKLWKRISPWKDKSKWYNRAWGLFLTFNFITFTRIWFRSGSSTDWDELEGQHSIWEEWFSANAMLQKIGSLFTSPSEWAIAKQVVPAFWEFFLLLGLGMIIHWLPSKWKSWYRVAFIKLPIVAKMLICVGTVVVLFLAFRTDSKPFIYFQF